MANKDNSKEGVHQEMFPVLGVLLGRCETSETLKFLWKLLVVTDASPDDNHADDNDNNSSKIYELMLRLCFHCAVAHSFLTTRDAKQQETLQREMQVSSDTKLQQSSESTLQFLLKSFSELCNNTQSTDPTFMEPNESNNHETIPQQSTFLQWHNSQVPSLLFSLSIFMRALLFPSFDVDETPSSVTLRQGWLFPSLDHDEASDNLVFASGNPSSWLYSIACTIPFHHHKKVGPAVSTTLGFGVHELLYVQSYVRLALTDKNYPTSFVFCLLAPKWHRLYSSLSEGFNLSTLEHSLVGYHGPTLILVEAFDKDTGKNITFGAFASQPWRKQSGAPDFYGDSDSFLFEIKPTFHVWRAKKSSPGKHVAANYQYFNFDNRPRTSTTSAARSESDRKYAQGIGMGGSKRRPRFFIAATLDHCYFGSNDATFESEHDLNETMTISSLDPFLDLHSLEIWGIGGDAALRALSRHHSNEDAHVQKARQVDKSAFLNDFRSGLIESKMFDFHQEMRNRDGGCLLDCHDDEEDGGRWQIGKPR